ncbi:hypothetical protein Tco_1404155 [Tanacetum coccineum]
MGWVATGVDVSCDDGWVMRRHRVVLLWRGDGRKGSDVKAMVEGEAKTTSYERLRGRLTAATKEPYDSIITVLIIQDCDGIPKRLTMYLNLWSYKVVRHRFNTTAGNPVKKILLKLNLSDHRSILTDSKEYIKIVMEVTGSSWLTDPLPDAYTRPTFIKIP